jgi:hypothetical protein
MKLRIITIKKKMKRKIIKIEMQDTERSELGMKNAYESRISVKSFEFLLSYKYCDQSDSIAATIHRQTCHNVLFSFGLQ